MSDASGVPDSVRVTASNVSQAGSGEPSSIDTP